MISMRAWRINGTVLPPIHRQCTVCCPIQNRYCREMRFTYICTYIPLLCETWNLKLWYDVIYLCTALFDNAWYLFSEYDYLEAWTALLVSFFHWFFLTGGHGVQKWPSCREQSQMWANILCHTVVNFDDWRVLIWYTARQCTGEELIATYQAEINSGACRTSVKGFNGFNGAQQLVAV